MAVLRPNWVPLMVNDQERAALQAQASAARLILAALIRKRLCEAKEMVLDPVKPPTRARGI